MSNVCHGPWAMAHGHGHAAPKTVKLHPLRCVLCAAIRDRRPWGTVPASEPYPAQRRSPTQRVGPGTDSSKLVSK